MHFSNSIAIIISLLCSFFPSHSETSRRFQFQHQVGDYPVVIARYGSRYLIWHSSEEISTFHQVILRWCYDLAYLEEDRSINGNTWRLVL